MAGYVGMNEWNKKLELNKSGSCRKIEKKNAHLIMTGPSQSLTELTVVTDCSVTNFEFSITNAAR